MLTIFPSKKAPCVQARRTLLRKNDYNVFRRYRGGWGLARKRQPALRYFTCVRLTAQNGVHLHRLAYFFQDEGKDAVRNAGSGADLEDTRTLAITITGGSGKMLRAARLLLARLDPRAWNAHRTEAPPLSLSVESKVVNTTQNAVRYSLYTPGLNLMAETAESTSGTPPVAYDSISFGGQPVAQVDVATSTTHWTFTDHLGTPLVQTDATGTPDWRAEYEPYGTVTTYRTGQTRHQPLRFAGQEYDPVASDREYNIFRWYKEGWGRYTQSDPMGSSAVSPYAYVDSNPVAWIDAWGLYRHMPGGPYHPSIPTRCTPEDSCSQLYEKLAEIEKAIESHQQWIKTHPEDTVHLDELDDWYNARNRCAMWIRKNCNTRKDCKVCKKAEMPAAVAIGGYLAYKLVEMCVAPYLVPLTP